MKAFIENEGNFLAALCITAYRSRRWSIGKGEGDHVIPLHFLNKPASIYFT
jgi:hypothetical protein